MEDVRNYQVKQAAKKAASASSNACLDWVKDNWLWVLIGVIVIAGLAYWFIFKKKKANQGTATEGSKLSETGSGGIRVSRQKPTGGPEY